nr:hypothetical protein [Tanacetum cinerariifolium]
SVQLNSTKYYTVLNAFMCCGVPLPLTLDLNNSHRPTEDVLPWPGNENMAFDLRPIEDVLSWPGNANMIFDLRPDLKCLLQFHGRTDDTKKENMSGRAEYRGRTGPMTADTKKENMSEHVERHGRTEPMTADTKKENMSGRAEYRGRTGLMTANTKKEIYPDMRSVTEGRSL